MTGDSEAKMPAPPIGSWWRNEADTGVMQVVGYHPDGWHVLCVDLAYRAERYQVLASHFEHADRYDAWLEDGRLVYRKRFNDLAERCEP